MTILALVLIPMCALEKHWGFLWAMVLGAVTLILSVVHIVYMLIVAPINNSRILVRFVVEALTMHPQSGLYEPLG